MLKEFRTKSMGRPTLYPWPQWANGKPWRAESGKDFRCTPAGFVSSLKAHARKNGLSVRVSELGDVVDFQFNRRPRSHKGN